MAGKVHHWKHGWIPLDATAQAVLDKRSSPKQFHVIEGQAGARNYHVEKMDGAPDVQLVSFGRESANVSVNDTLPIDWGTSDHSADEIKRDVATNIQEVFDRFPGLKAKPIQVNMTDSEHQFFAATEQTADTPISIDKVLYSDAYVAEKIQEFQRARYQMAANGNVSIDEFRRRVVAHEMAHVMNDRAQMKATKGLTGRDIVQMQVAGKELPHDPITDFEMEPTTLRKEGYLYSTDLSDIDKERPRWQVDALGAKSGYATATPLEFYAEAFLDGYVNGDRATRSGKRAIELATQLYGKAAT